MLLKARRFINSKLDNIVDLYKKDKNRELTLEEAGFWKSIKTSINISRGKFFEKYLDKKYDKAFNKYENKFDELKEKLDNKEISKEEFDKKIEKVDYKLNKAEYVLGYDETKPKNPTIQRAIANAKKAVRAVGKGIAKAVAFPIVMGYKGIKAVRNKVVTIGREGKIAVLTAGKVVSNTAKTVTEKVGPIAQEVKEIEETKRDIREIENSKRLDERGKISSRLDAYRNSSEAIQNAIISDDYKAALKEDKRREREAARRENLHMDKQKQHIDHEEAVIKAEENNEQTKEPQQLEND